MTEDSTDRLEDSGVSESIEKPGKFLPWLVLLMAALAMLYFLNKGCGVSGRTHETGLEVTTDTTSLIAKESAQTRTKSSEVVTGGDVIGKMQQVVASGSVDPNTAYILGEVMFLNKTAGFADADLKELDGLAALMHRFDDLQIRIEAHTDNTGGAKENLHLSAEQGLAVKQYLRDKSIPPERIAVAGRGQYKPIAPNTSADGRARNNRIEIFLSVNN